MNELLLLAAFTCAVALGWYSSRLSLFRRKKHSVNNQLNKDYFTGLSYLLNDQQDQAIETFMRVLEINPETIDTHIAMGNLYRSKGDTEKAIRIHQNLFARPSLSQELTQRVQLELARDFFAAGLYDRAERLLQELTDSVSSDIRLNSHLLLLRIYEQEKEWQKAINTGSSNLLKDQPDSRKALAHYYCEQAEQEIQQQHLTQARKLLKQALYYDPGCIRANWIAADLEFRNHNLRKGRSILLRIPEQDPSFYSLILPRLNGLISNKEMHKVLDQAIEAFPSRTAVALKADLLQMELNNDAALSYLEALSDKQKLHSPFMVARELRYISSPLAPGLHKSRLDGLLSRLNTHESLQHNLRCLSCGFKSHQSELWQCPKCRSWGTLRPDDRLN